MSPRQPASFSSRQPASGTRHDAASCAHENTLLDIRLLFPSSESRLPLMLLGCSHLNRYRDRCRYRHRDRYRSCRFLLLSIAISILMPHPISESKEREFENRRRTAVCAAYRATPWRATEEGPGCVSHGGQTAPPPYACGKARRTAARLHKQAYIPAVSGGGGPCFAEAASQGNPAALQFGNLPVPKASLHAGRR